MNDKQQLAAMGAQYRLTEEQANGLAERMPQTGALQVIDDEPLCMAKRIEELEAQVRVMAELLQKARKYVTALGKPDDEVSAVQMTVSRIDALLAGQVPAPAAPEGWQLVPVEVTLPMQHAYFGVIDKNMQRVETDCRFGRYDSAKEAYRAMLAAAPSLGYTK